MAAIFTPRADLVLRVTVLALLLLLVGGAWGWYRWYHSPYHTRVGWAVAQEIPFSHAHHVGGLGIDCRYCHEYAAESSFAGIPTTDTCMRCHGQLWTEAPMLEPLRASWRTGQRLAWQRVHRLPDHVFFDHSVHVHAGVGCTTCHGAVNEMPLMYKSETLLMKWCLDCHRDPAPHIRPRAEVYSVDYVPPRNARAQGERLMNDYGIDRTGLTSCTACHR